ncbi:hypothetical protein DSO57_1014927 [Entomophthora muscae]|uniref:Uncharacterized protein n=1 Tax=Entomophthora muscae TaxID=34485 RepID=A0ACC2U3C0_9FUNG|nr:hypothetical protein DSO57_1014927 [Entomophthora muscae]
MKLLLTICTLIASVKPDQVTIITESTSDVPTDIPMRLGKNIVWAQDFSMHHLTQGSERSKHSLYDGGSLTYIHHCFVKYNQKFRFGEPVPVSKVEACMNPTCTVKVDRRITRYTQKEAWTQIGTQGATDLASELIPRSFLQGKHCPYLQRPWLCSSLLQTDLLPS